MEAGEDELGMVFAELEIGLKLGEGGFGVVRLARHRVSGALYAVKSIEKVRIRRVGEERTFELLESSRLFLGRRCYCFVPNVFSYVKNIND